MPDTSPTPVDLDAIEDRWLQMCPSCDAGMSMTCQCPTGDPRNVISNLVDEIRRLRTSIGPDSERIREWEAENARLRDAWATDGQRANEAECLLNELRAGLLPGPDDIVVSREALRDILENEDHGHFYYMAGAECRSCRARESIAAALSQPHPEETP